MSKREVIDLQPGPQRLAGSLRVDVLIYGGAAGAGKLLPIDTEVATPIGFTPIGRLRLGDVVYGSDGEPCRVLTVGAEQTPEVSYRLTFDDGLQIVACSDHEWVTSTELERLRVLRCSEEWRKARRESRASRGTGRRPDLAERNRETHASKNLPTSGVRTTRQIVDSLFGSKGRPNHSIELCAPLAGFESVPLDAYVLGAWLGDGSTRDGVLTSADPEIAKRLALHYLCETTRAKEGGPTLTYYFKGLKKALRGAGVLGDKHIPAPYLRAPVEARQELLRGLMDTDGTVCKKGKTSFTTTNASLKNGFLELLWGLGVRAVAAEGRARLYEKDCGPVWDVHFSAPFSVFHLPRKKARERLTRRSSTRRRFIVRAERVPSEPMRCIQVSSPDSTYLIGRECLVTHNSRFLVHSGAEWYDKAGMASFIFRRTSPELSGEGSLWAETTDVYPHLGGVPTESRLRWRFGAGGGVKLAHLQHEKDKLKHQGKQYSAIGFDELTHFLESQWWYLFSRLRSPHGIPTRMRATCNPDPDAFFLDWIRPYLTEEGVPDRAMAGAVRWFTREGNKLRWFERKQDAPDHANSFAFVPGNLSDNPALELKDPTYRSKLMLLPIAEQIRLLGGNWFFRPSSGDYFQSGWFPRVPSDAMGRVLAGFKAQLRIVKRWRAWDLAGTMGPADGKHRVPHAPRDPAESQASEAKDPDFTCSWLFELLDDGRIFLSDHTAHRDTPGAIEFLMASTAARDPAGTVQVVWRDPAQAGVHQETILRRVLKGRRVATCPTFRPELVAKIASREAFAGRLLLPADAPWISAVMKELEGYPNAAHDDAVSSLGLGCVYWLDNAGRLGKVHGVSADAIAPGQPLVEARERQARAGTEVKATSRFREF